uniref:Uncharacterized protein n=1 Tax=Parascaris univalens TaxID=6257 RepID=A0A915BSF1_PARUN
MMAAMELSKLETCRVMQSCPLCGTTHSYVPFTLYNMGRHLYDSLVNGMQKSHARTSERFFESTSIAATSARWPSRTSLAGARYFGVRSSVYRWCATVWSVTTIDKMKKRWLIVSRIYASTK